MLVNYLVSLYATISYSSTEMPNPIHNRLENNTTRPIQERVVKMTLSDKKDCKIMQPFVERIMLLDLLGIQKLSFCRDLNAQI